MKNLKELTKEQRDEIYNIIQENVEEQFQNASLESLDNFNNFIYIKDNNLEKEKKNSIIGTINTATNKIHVKNPSYQEKLGVLSYFLSISFKEEWGYKKGFEMNGELK